eukprot:TRINITY_DN19446_c0_g1_i4.p1 TRINITY_DN19446_c0_g1~~TRINITY_DN19446_c0_g1_i4.p1  ORF type:complete len:103 (-),score=0.83 TRINITY_DN19446_c0_g1_i4:143-451(-)
MVAVRLTLMGSTLMSLQCLTAASQHKSVIKSKPDLILRIRTVFTGVRRLPRTITAVSTLASNTSFAPRPLLLGLEPVCITEGRCCWAPQVRRQAGRGCGVMV